jgi:Putative transposase of IS4/5 family (DUF4096)
LIPLTVPEVRRLMLAMAGSVEERDFRLGWSVWRRAHQAVAARCKKASRAARAALRREGSSEDHAEPKITALTSEETRLTDTEWERVRPLLPPQRGQVGRPLNDHCQVLGGILWVARTGSSWREMPEEYGDWSTAYHRWRAWKKRGLWQRILQALGDEELPGPVTKDAN